MTPSAGQFYGSQIPTMGMNISHMQKPTVGAVSISLILFILYYFSLSYSYRIIMCYASGSNCTELIYSLCKQSTNSSRTVIARQFDSSTHIHIPKRIYWFILILFCLVFLSEWTRNYCIAFCFIDGCSLCVCVQCARIPSSSINVNQHMYLT